MKQTEWPSVLRIVQSVRTQEYRKQITAFTDLPADNLLRLLSEIQESDIKDVDEVQLLRRLKLNRLTERYGQNA